MTETTAQPLTREDVAAALTEALEAATVLTPHGPTEYTIGGGVQNAIESEAVRILRNFGIPSRAERVSRDRHPAGKRLPIPLTREDIRIAGYSIADHFLDGLLPALIRANVLSNQPEISSQISDDWESAVDRVTSETGSHRVELLSPTTLDLLNRRTGRRSFTDLFDRERDAWTNDGVNGTRLGRNGNEAATLGAPSDFGVESHSFRAPSGHRVTPPAVMDDIAHETSPSVDGCGDPTVGEAGSVGGASVPPTEKVMIDSLVESIRDARVDEVAALRLQRAAESNLAEMNDNLAYAKNQTRTAELALLDHINGGAA